MKKNVKTNEIPMVSVSLICYNQKDYISKAIDSVLMQKTTFPYEIVLADDCSTDGTADICAEYAQKYPDIIKYLPRKKNVGCVRNYLENYKRCTGKYVSYLEGDDFFIDPYKLQKQFDFLENNLDYVICCSHVEVVDEFGSFHGQLLSQMNDTYTVNELCRGDFISTPTCMVRNHLIDEVPEWLYEFSGCDWTFDIVNSAYGKIKFLDERLSAYRVHNHGEWNKLSEKERLNSVINMVKKVNKYTHYKYADDFNVYLNNLIEDRKRLYNRNKIYHTLSYIKHHPLFLFQSRFYKNLIKKIFIRIYNATEPNLSVTSRLYSMQSEIDYLKINATSAKYETDLLILDDFFPIEFSGFRFSEFNTYLENFEKVKVITTLSGKFFSSEFRSNAQIILDYYAKYPKNKPAILLYDNNLNIKAKLAYAVFLGNIYNYLNFLEQRNIPFVFTLYPGGSFALNNEESDRKLKAVFNSKLFRKVIVTQKITYNYLINKNLCSKEQIEFINGGIILDNQSSLMLGKKQHFGFNKKTFDICFVANKYTEDGRDKGYDYFIKFAKAFSKKHNNVQYHVVGGFDANVLDVKELGNCIHFYGTKPFSWFREFYRDKDIILSPNIPFQIGPGFFDGFPLTCVLDAMNCEIAAFCCDELHSNVAYTDGKDMVFIPHNVNEIVKKVEYYYEHPDLLKELAINGKKTTEKNYSFEAQLKPRIKLINECMEGKK